MKCIFMMIRPLSLHNIFGWKKQVPILKKIMLFSFTEYLELFQPKKKDLATNLNWVLTSFTFTKRLIGVLWQTATTQHNFNLFEGHVRLDMIKGHQNIALALFFFSNIPWNNQKLHWLWGNDVKTCIYVHGDSHFSPGHIVTLCAVAADSSFNKSFFIRWGLLMLGKFQISGIFLTPIW